MAGSSTRQQNADDRNDHQQLDEGERKSPGAATALSSQHDFSPISQRMDRNRVHDGQPIKIQQFDAPLPRTRRASEPTNDRPRFDRFAAELPAPQVQ